MNFLAHLYLSGEDENLCFGNFIADSLKGNTYKTYSLAVQKGVELHREIDTYTDQHTIFRQHCKLLFDQHRHYARVIMDVLYDHFLALHWNRFSPISLEQYAQKFYRMVDHRIDELPLAMHRLFHLMKSQNWLVSYSSEQGITNILNQMSKRTTFESNFGQAGELIFPIREKVENEFFLFFDEINRFCKKYVLSIKK